MFTLNDLLDQVDCQGEVKVLVIDESTGETTEVFHGNDLKQVPYEIGCRELAYIYSGIGDNEDFCTYYEVIE